MVVAAERAGVRHMTAFTYRFVPAMQYMHHLVTSGAIGTALALSRTALPGLGAARHRLAAAVVGGRLGRDRRHALASPGLRALPRGPDAARDRADLADLADTRRRGRRRASFGHRGLGRVSGRVRQRRHRRVRKREDRHRLCRRRHQPRFLRGQRQRRRGDLRAVASASRAPGGQGRQLRRRRPCRPRSGRSPVRPATAKPTRGRASGTTRTSSSSKPFTGIAPAVRRSSTACACRK